MGFGAPVGAALLAEFVLNAGLEDNQDVEFDHEGEPGAGLGAVGAGCRPARPPFLEPS